MTFKGLHLLGATVVAAGVTAGCSGGSGGAGITAGPGQGSLSIGLMDAAADVDEIWIEISALRIKPAGNEPPIEFEFDAPVQEDLLTLTPDAPAWLLDSEAVPAGQYDWIELELNADFDGVYDSYVVTRDLNEFELSVPSDSLRLVSGFTVTADAQSEFVIDWDARRGLVDPPGQPGYMLRPAFRIIDMTQFGTLSGTIEPALIVTPECGVDDELNGDPNIGNVVYVYAGHDAPLDDIDEAEGDNEPAGPVATAAVTQDLSGAYAYSTILSPGEYTVAFTCLAGFDDPEEDNPNEPVDLDTATDDRPVAFMDLGEDGNVTIDDGDEISVDF